MAEVRITKNQLIEFNVIRRIKAKILVLGKLDKLLFGTEKKDEK